MPFCSLNFSSLWALLPFHQLIIPIKSHHFSHELPLCGHLSSKILTFLPLLELSLSPPKNLPVPLRIFSPLPALTNLSFLLSYVDVTMKLATLSAITYYQRHTTSVPRISFHSTGSLSYGKGCLSFVIWAISHWQLSWCTGGGSELKFLSPQHLTSSTPFVLRAIMELPCLSLEPAGLQILSSILGLCDIGIFRQMELLLENLSLSPPTRNYLFCFSFYLSEPIWSFLFYS